MFLPFGYNQEESTHPYPCGKAVGLETEAEAELLGLQYH